MASKILFTQVPSKTPAPVSRNPTQWPVGVKKPLYQTTINPVPPPPAVATPAPVEEAKEIKDQEMPPAVPELLRETTQAPDEDEATADEAQDEHQEVEEETKPKKKRKFVPKNKKPCPESAQDCAKCQHDKERGIVSNPSAWNTYLKQFEAANPTMDTFTCRVRARQLYVPRSGKRKSFERIYRETYMAHHPAAKKLDDDSLRRAIRESFTNETFACV